MSESVKVAVRCRPISQKELQNKCRSVVTVDSSTRSCSLAEATGQGKVYQFDATFGPGASTEVVYEEVGSYVVEAVLDGYNGTVFAYGQTGCGKSYTMRGFVERALEHLFEATSTSSSDMRYLALLTYLEIYNEKLRDLLQATDPTNENQLQLKEDPVRGTYVAGGLREVTVKNARDCTRLVDQGDRRRAAAATRMNAASSRSHAVLTISLEAIAIGGPGQAGTGAVRRGRLHLVDLAGSERQGRTGATGDRLKEAASINLSLSALGNVISALAAGNGRHVPYRDSKLTRLLRDSLGGNARTLMIACVSPSDTDAEETLSTLRYAARARCIKNKPIVNEDPKDALLRQYQLELQRLRKLIESNESRDPPERLEPEPEICTEEVPEQRPKALSPRPEIENVAAEPERDERRWRKREAAKQEVLRRLERLTIGGEALGDAEIRRRRERRRKRLQALAKALERSSEEGNGGAFEVYGQLKSTEEALKKMARKAKQLEAEATDLQASWDEERRELLRRELLSQQICEAMIPHLRPGCPLRDVAAVRAAASWSSELGRWRLPDVSSRIPLPPAPLSVPVEPFKPDLNNNNSNNNNNGSGSGGSSNNDNSSSGTGAATAATSDGSPDEESAAEDHFAEVGTGKTNIADVYFKRNRIDKILAHVREAKTFELGARMSKSGSSSESPGPLSVGQQHPLQLGSLGALNLQGGPEKPPPAVPFDSWVDEVPDKASSPPYGSFNRTHQLQPHPRILEALPVYPPISASALPQRLQGPIS